MNKSALSYLLLCQVLRVNPGTAEDDLLRERLKQGNIDWTYLFQLSDKEHMTTALATALRQQNRTLRVWLEAILFNCNILRSCV